MYLNISICYTWTFFTNVICYFPTEESQKHSTRNGTVLLPYLFYPILEIPDFLPTDIFV